MKNINDLLDAAKEVTGSDNQTAKRIGQYQTVVSGWRVSEKRKARSKPNDKDRAMLAEITGWSFEEVVAAVNANDDPEFWGNFVKRLGGIAAAVLVCVNLIMTPTPSEAAPVLKTHESIMYIMLNNDCINKAIK